MGTGVLSGSKGTSFLRGWGPAKDESFVFSSSAFDSSISRAYNVSIHGFQDWFLPVERFLRRTPRLKKYIPTIIPAAIKRIHKMEIHKLT